VKRTICIFLSFLLPVTAFAQEAPPTEYQLTEPTQEILPLRRGTAAPRDGLLIDASDLLQIRADYERLRYLLTRTTERDEEVCSVRVQIEQARTSACGERVSLRDELWNARQAELLQQIAAAREQAQRAAERGWWEAPALWAVIGAAIVGLVWVATSVR
jgi:hypothetical protein